MTTTYDPADPAYVDEADARAELTRVFDVCGGCRRCVDRCPSFPTLFELIDRHGDRDAGRLTPAEQDRVVDGCFQCKLCHLECPYASGRHEFDLDVPRLMLRARSMQHANGHVPSRARMATRVMARTDRVGALAVATGPIADRVVDAAPGSAVRRMVARLTGVSAVRLLPPFARQRFSTWFRTRPRISLTRGQGRVTVFPTCLVEYHDPDIGKDLVRVYERNGVECEVSEIGCCGAPWLHAGHVDRFSRIARNNVAELAARVRAGTDIVVPQPTCSYVLKRDYVDVVGGPDAALVAEHTFDAAEYLVDLHRGATTQLDTDFPGELPEVITYHAPCHLRAQDIGLRSRDLLRLTGARVDLVQQCAGIDGMWGLRAGNEDLSVPIAEQLGEQIEQAGGAPIAGDCHLANTAIREQTGRRALHPLQILARAYGIPDAP